MRYSLPDALKPGELIFNAGHLEPNGKTRGACDDSSARRLLEMLHRLLGRGIRSARAKDIPSPPLAHDVILPKLSDSWGTVLEGHGKKFGTSRGLTAEERGIALGLLFQLSQSAVVTRQEPITLDRREVFFSPSHEWVGVFPYLRAIWDCNECVCVFHTAGIGSQFLPWAISKPDNERLVKILNFCREDVVVVVPAIVPLDNELLVVLKEERRRIWAATRLE